MNRTATACWTCRRGGLVLALGVVGAATVPTASGATSATAAEPKVIEVTTDTPLRRRDAAPPGRAGRPRSVLRRAARRLPHHHHRVGRLTDQRLRDQGRLRRHEGRLRRLAVRRPARRRGTARRVRPRGRQGRAAGRRARAADEGRRACQHRSGRCRGPGTPTGARHRQRAAARPGHPGVLRQPGQRRQHRGPVGPGLLRRRQQRLRLLPGQQLREVRSRARGRERRRAPTTAWSAGCSSPTTTRTSATTTTPRETKLGVDAVTAADPYVDYASFDTNKDGSLSVSELHVTVIVAGYETSYGGAGNVCGNSVWGHQGGLHGSAPKLDGTVVEPLRRDDVRRVDVHAQQRARPEVDDRGHGPRDRVTTSASPTSTTPTSPARAWPSGARCRPAAGTGSARPSPGPPRPGMDAFSKSYQGWLAPTPVVGAVNGAPLPSSATSPTAYRLRGEPRRRGLEVRGAQGRGRVLPGREPAAGRLGRRPPRLRRDRLPRRRGRHVQQQGQRRREPPAGRRRRGRRQPGHEHLRLPRLGRRRVPRLQRPRRLHATRRARRRRSTPASRRVRRCTSTAGAPTR